MKFAVFAVLLFTAGAACLAGELPAKLDVAGMMRFPDEDGNVLPDFSSAGYMGGGVALPDVPAVKELSPEPEGCDRERIQSALDAIGELEPCGNGFRGALLLRAGEYRVEGSLHIRNSGVVLRGEGQFPGGTALVATKEDTAPWAEKHSLVYLGDPKRVLERIFPRLGFLEKVFETELAGDKVPVGSREIHVKNPEGFAGGDSIVIETYPNMKWLEAIDLVDEWSEGLPFRYHRYERRITGIEGSRLTLDAPMVHYIDRRMFSRLPVWKYTDNDRISRSGVEHLRLKTSYDRENPWGETHARTAVFVNQARDCWVRNVSALHFSFAAVNVQRGARNITVQDCAYLRPVSLIAGSRRYAFPVQGSRVLVQRCYSRRSRHAFASGANAAGPNVYLDNLAENEYHDIGPHHRWGTGYLYDNIMAPGGRIDVQKVRGGHGWRGVNHVFWNCMSAGMRCDQPRTGDTNWSVGSIASRRPGQVHQEPGVWISHGRRVEPRSLYLWQLEERLGGEAVSNVTIEVQRRHDENTIEDYLRSQFAEYTERENANKDNLLRGCYRFKHIQGRHASSWRYESSKKNLDRQILSKYLNEGIINRTENPVYGDDSALEFPAGVLWHWYTSALPYPSTSAVEYNYTLEFDYKTGKRGSISPRINQVVIEYDENNRSNWRNMGSTAGPVAFGEGGWERYSFSFSLEPELDGQGVPYPMFVRLRLEADGNFMLANPELRVKGR